MGQIAREYEAGLETGRVKRVNIYLAVLTVFALFAAITLCVVWYRFSTTLSYTRGLLDQQIAETHQMSLDYAAELAQKDALLSAVNAQLEQTRREDAAMLSQMNNTLNSVNSQLTASQNELADASNALNDATSKIRFYEAQSGQLATIQNELSMYKQTYGTVVKAAVKPPFANANIVPNPDAKDPTFAQLIEFIKNDKTDELPYTPGKYVCGEYASDVYNKAGEAGIRAAWVAIKFPDYWHALNAFNTTDKGLVFIDCTGLGAGQTWPVNRDKTIEPKLGSDYCCRSLFDNIGWASLGVVQDIQIYW